MYYYVNFKSKDNELQFTGPIIDKKITNFFQIREYYFEENDKCHKEFYI